MIPLKLFSNGYRNIYSLGNPRNSQFAMLQQLKNGFFSSLWFSLLNQPHTGPRPFWQSTHLTDKLGARLRRTTKSIALLAISKLPSSDTVGRNRPGILAGAGSLVLVAVNLPIPLAISLPPNPQKRCLAS